MSGLFKTKVRKVGTSLGVLIPKDLITQHRIHEGETVEIALIKEKKLKLIEEAFGVAKGAKNFERDRSDRLEG